MGVWPDATVCGVVCTGMKLPDFFRAAKKSMPGPTSWSEPPLPSEAAMTPETAELEVSGLPFMATWPLYSGLVRSFHVVGGLLTSALL